MWEARYNDIEITLIQLTLMIGSNKFKWRKMDCSRQQGVCISALGGPIACRTRGSGEQARNVFIGV
jgi:hypothetical protein